MISFLKTVEITINNSVKEKLIGVVSQPLFDVIDDPVSLSIWKTVKRVSDPVRETTRNCVRNIFFQKIQKYDFGK